MRSWRVLVTGSSGFVGRRLVAELARNHQVYCIARRSQAQCGAPYHPNIKWMQVDIGDKEALSVAAKQMASGGGVDVVFHLAAHYDFTGLEHPEYWRTNVEGLRNVLEICKDLGIRRFIFASSVAACPYPPPGKFITEDTPPTGDHIYAVTKRIGEEMLEEYRPFFSSCIVRLAALFSDWCEYPPLYSLLESWLEGPFGGRLLAGKGRTALPYLHVRDAISFFMTLLDQVDLPCPGEVLICATKGAVSHLDLFNTVSIHAKGRRERPITVPRWACAVGILLRSMAGKVAGKEPFERLWMVRYIDKVLAVDPSRTHARLRWAPRCRLEILRRVPFMLENRRSNPVEWHARNQAAMKKVQVRENLLVCKLLEKHEDKIFSRWMEFILGSSGEKLMPHYRNLPLERLRWRHRHALRNLVNAIRTGDKAIFMHHCSDVAQRRFSQGVPRREVCNALDSLTYACISVLLDDPEAEGLEDIIQEQISTTIQFGCDKVAETYEELEDEAKRSEEKSVTGER